MGSNMWTRLLSGMGLMWGFGDGEGELSCWDSGGGEAFRYGQV
jgi:hypothetical protein